MGRKSGSIATGGMIFWYRDDLGDSPLTGNSALSNGRSNYCTNRCSRNIKSIADNSCKTCFCFVCGANLIHVTDMSLSAILGSYDSL